MDIKIECRNLTNDEYKWEQTAFEDHSIEFDNPPDRQIRISFVASDGDMFVGCSSGLAQKIGSCYGKYVFLSDLLVEKKYRRKGLGKKLLKMLENKLKPLGIEFVWTWTAGYEAPNFYLKQGYEIFSSFEKYYASGHARIGLIKKL